MKKNRSFLTAILFVFAFTFNLYGQKEKSADDTVPPVNYDAELAQELGADEYGMRQFVLVILKTGRAEEIKDEKKRKELFAGHFSNMGKLAEAGKLVLAGPFIEGGKKRGLFIFNVQTIEEAKKLVETDPAVQAGIFEYELTKWYGSAALMKISEIHRQIQKRSIE